MKPALAFRQPHYPKAWHELPNGNAILSAIDQQLQSWWPKFFGYYLLKMGALSAEVCTTTSSIKHQITTAPLGEKGDIIADIDDLPLQEHSVDVCLLSHALEFSLDPHHVIREANRVLIPNGYLVITGFNPFSLAGINRFIPYRKQQSPWNEHFFTPMRVKDWLQLMGFEILADQRCLHTNLVGNIGEGKVSLFWQNLASKYFTSLGSVYVIVAKKRVLPLTPIKPKWKIPAQFQPVKVPSMRVSPINSNKSSQSRKHI